MPDGLAAVGAAKDPSRSAPLNMSTYISGLITQQNPMSGGAVPYIQQKYYSATRYDRLIGGVNAELSVRLTLTRAPGSSIYNAQSFQQPNRWYSFKPIVNGKEIVRVMVDTASNVYDGTGPNTQNNLLTKSAGAGKTQFQAVGDTLYFSNGVDLKKWVWSQLTWAASTLYDGTATSDMNLGDFIVDSNHNIQQAVGGFTLQITSVQVAGNRLIVTYSTAGMLANPSGQPAGLPFSTGGSMPSGDYYLRVCGVDPDGNVTAAGLESAAVFTTGSTSQIFWRWPAIAGAVSYRVYVGSSSGGEATYFTTQVNSFAQTQATSTVAGAPPSVNSTSIAVPDNLYGMAGVNLTFSGFTNATFLNGLTIPLYSVLPGGQTSNQLTIPLTHATYPNTTDTGTATSGTGITGATPPTWATGLGAVTQDGGAQWINRGPNLQNWGITAPANPPVVTPVAAPLTNDPDWQPSTFYWPSCCCYVIELGIPSIMLLTTAGTTGAAAPAWDIGGIGNYTQDGTALWQYQGRVAWSPNTNYAQGAYTTFQPTTGKMQVYIALNTGTSAAAQGGWSTGVGSAVVDGGITWSCLGTILPYSPASAVTFALQSWPTSGSSSFRQSMTITPTATAPSILYNLGSQAAFFEIGGRVTVSGCASSAMNGSGTVLGANIALLYTTGQNGFAASIPFSGSSYKPYTDQVGGSVAYTPPGVGLSPNVNVSSAGTVLDSNGYLEQVQDPGGFSGLIHPTWGAFGALTSETLSAPITGFVIANNVATIFAANNFASTQSTTVTIAGLQIGTALNGTWPLLSASATQFTIYTAQANESSTNDSGTATSATGAEWINAGGSSPATTTGRFYAYAYRNSVTRHVGTASPRTPIQTLRGGFLASLQGYGSADPQVDSIVIYQTEDGGSTLLKADIIANPGGGVTWTYVDSIADVNLDFLTEAATAGQNNPPPAGFLPSSYHLGRIWGYVNSKLICSGGPDTTTGSGNEAFPLSNYWQMPETLTKTRATSVGLLIYGTANVYIQTGLGTVAQPFIPPPTFQEGIGLLSYDAETVNGSTTYLMTSAGRVISFDPGAGEVEVGFFIGDLLSGIDPASAYLTFHEGSSEDMALYVGDGSTGWYRLSTLAAPESGQIWSPKRTIVGGCGAIQSVQVAPGEAGAKQRLLLMGAASGSGPILQRDYSVYEDNGSAYPMYVDLGTMLLCQPGTEAEVDFVTLESLLIGTRPTVGLLLGELSGYTASPPFVTLVANRRDLPLLPAAKTLYSDRYDLAQNQNQQSCRHLQMRITWATEAAANELLTHTIYGTLRPQAEK